MTPHCRGIISSVTGSARIVARVPSAAVGGRNLPSNVNRATFGFSRRRDGGGDDEGRHWIP
jgi:hypothetical protein